MSPAVGKSTSNETTATHRQERDQVRLFVFVSCSESSASASSHGEIAIFNDFHNTIENRLLLGSILRHSNAVAIRCSKQQNHEVCIAFLLLTCKSMKK